jgi:hypothetical protein
MPDVTNSFNPIALGILSPKRTFVAVWRMDGYAEVRVPGLPGGPKLLYPEDLGIAITQSGEGCLVKFPRTRMGCILSS